MTVEERVRNFIQTWYGDPCLSPHAVDGMRDDLIQKFRDQIEDCAQIADQHEVEETERAAESKRNGKGLSELGHVFEATAAGTIARAIRARSEKEKQKINRGVRPV